MNGRVGVMGRRMRGGRTAMGVAVAAGIVSCALGAVAVSGPEYSAEEVQLRGLNQELSQTFDIKERARLEAEMQTLQVNASRTSRP
jgi:hypothetical protein